LSFGILRRVGVSPIGFAKFYFYPADIKALAAVSYFHPEYVTRFGDLTCFVQPDIFDVVLRYYIAGRNRGFCADVDISSHINNVTIVSYDRTFDPFIATWKEHRLVKTHLILYCLSEFRPKDCNGETKSIIAKFKENPSEAHVFAYTYDYNLEIDNNDKIVSGTWLNIPGNDSHPDFIWLPVGKGDDDNLKYTNDFGNSNLRYSDIVKLLSIPR
jgi:hypothetical protein